MDDAVVSLVLLAAFVLASLALTSDLWRRGPRMQRWTARDDRAVAELTLSTRRTD